MFVELTHLKNRTGFATIFLFFSFYLHFFYSRPLNLRIVYQSDYTSICIIHLWHTNMRTPKRFMPINRLNVKTCNPIVNKFDIWWTDARHFSIDSIPKMKGKNNEFPRISNIFVTWAFVLSMPWKIHWLHSLPVCVCVDPMSVLQSVWSIYWKIYKVTGKKMTAQCSALHLSF